MLENIISDKYILAHIFGLRYIFDNTGSGVNCYFCGREEGACDADHYGEPVLCQTDDPEYRNFGDGCYVGHSGK